MLKHLYIKNFTLIDVLDIDFYPGFSVITGETGAGKSIILGALHLLLGQRADSKQVKADTQKCIIEANFDITKYDLSSVFEEADVDYDGQECLLRREISATGKSRSFINDTPVSLAQMKEIGEHLIDIHSQHQNLLLQKEDFQINVVDLLADNADILKAYREAYGNYRQAQKRYDDAVEAVKRNKENEDFLRYQYNELDAANLKEDEQAELEQSLNTLSHIEEIKGALYESYNAMAADDTGCVSQLYTAMNRLGSITGVYGEVEEVSARLNELYIEIKDIANELGGRLDKIDFNPSDLENISQRLDKIYELQHKYKVDSVEELIALRDKFKSELEKIDGGDLYISELQQACKEAETKCSLSGKALTESRKQAAKLIEKEMKDRLIPLGIPNVRFSIDITPAGYTPVGADKVSFLFSANSSSPLQPVAQVASGGEVARVMLSLKALISGAVKLPTIIFDEIDTGVSGRVAEQMAHIMKTMGERNRQVISITHLPQIAAMGATHYKVSKSETAHGTISKMVMLTDEERITEVAQMLSGSDISQAAIDNAKSLLKL